LFHDFRDLVEVHVARSEIRSSVGDRDVRPTIEGIAGQTTAHPGPVDVGVAIGTGVPLRAPLLHPTPLPLFGILIDYSECLGEYTCCLQR
jgi:hypothetical protein